MPSIRNERGFTLTELLVVMAVLGIVLAGVFVIQEQGTRSYLIGASRVEVQQNARTTLELMVRELRSAQSVTAWAAPVTSRSWTRPAPPFAISWSAPR